MAIEPSQSESFLQCLNTFINFSLHLNQKGAEKNLSAAPSLAGQHIISDRRESKECTPDGSEDSAGEAHHRDGVEQHLSVVHHDESKACDGSSSGTAAETDAQSIGSTITTKSQKQSSEQERGGSRERAKVRSIKSSAGAASTGSGAKQQECNSRQGDRVQGVPLAAESVCVSCVLDAPNNSVEQQRLDQDRESMSALSAEAGSRYSNITKCPGKCTNCGEGHHRHLCAKECRRCHRGVPMSCSCWRWMQRRNRERDGLEPLEYTPSVSIQGHEESRSSSKRRAYNALRDFVSLHPFVMWLQRSDMFDLQVEDQLRILLEAMHWEDRSTL